MSDQDCCASYLGGCYCNLEEAAAEAIECGLDVRCGGGLPCMCSNFPEVDDPLGQSVTVTDPLDINSLHNTLGATFDTPVQSTAVESSCPDKASHSVTASNCCKNNPPPSSVALEPDPSNYHAGLDPVTQGHLQQYQAAEVTEATLSFSNARHHSATFGSYIERPTMAPTMPMPFPFAPDISESDGLRPDSFQSYAPGSVAQKQSKQTGKSCGCGCNTQPETRPLQSQLTSPNALETKFWPATAIVPPTAPPVEPAMVPAKRTQCDCKIDRASGNACSPHCACIDADVERASRAIVELFASKCDKPSPLCCAAHGYPFGDSDEAKVNRNAGCRRCENDVTCPVNNANVFDCDESPIFYHNRERATEPKLLAANGVSKKCTCSNIPFSTLHKLSHAEHIGSPRTDVAQPNTASTRGKCCCSCNKRELHDNLVPRKGGTTNPPNSHIGERIASSSCCNAAARDISRCPSGDRATCNSESLRQDSSLLLQALKSATYPSGTKDRPFACSKCEATFVFKQNRDRHVIEVHLGHRPFKCNQEGCNAAFKNSSGLKQHQSTVHMKERPFKCNLCEASFGQRNHLTQHTSAVHDRRRPFTCSVCGSAFSNRGNLNQHIRRRKHEQLADGRQQTPIIKSQDNDE